MAKSPGHQQFPEHTVREERPNQKFKAIVNGKVVAQSKDVIKVVEDEHPDRYYFPRADVKMEMLEPSKTTTKCPFKGEAHYFSLKEEDKTIEDAVWTYEEPYEEHQALKDRLAFYDDKFSTLDIKAD